MSGHSKWATIKRQKGVNDAKRGALFTKLSKAITIAVQQGGGIGDPSQNFKLRLVMETARGANMPKENIQRAIERATEKNAQALEEVVYEGFGPGGIAVLVEAATDNKNRTTSEVQNIFNKNGGNMGQPGSVAYMFIQKGQVAIVKNGKTADEIFLDAADSGAEDIEEGDDEVFIYTMPTQLAKVRDLLSQKGYDTQETEVVRKATIPVVLSDTDGERVMDFVERLEDLDDVQKVYTNIA
ncbi:MAG TPA: YebC/PmpR family DNA-binding transcriptional regulator [Patescibacteria group bacterium]|nr:YebC/PmpR family DNA-binding transcriptional regulator [Patescibacteria group bacterium]